MATLLNDMAIAYFDLKTLLFLPFTLPFLLAKLELGKREVDTFLAYSSAATAMLLIMF